MAQNLTELRNPIRPDGVPSHRSHGKRGPLENDLLPVMALLGAVYGWVLACIAGAVALVVILAG
jgi:hypothetical protein